MNQRNEQQTGNKRKTMALATGGSGRFFRDDDTGA